jgi:hypothetical protein
MRKLFLIVVTILPIISSCEKDPSPPSDVVCDVTGVYVGTATDRFSTVSPNVYRFFGNNYMSSSTTLAAPENAFGGYRNSCDSIVWNAHNNINNHLYVYKCILTNNRTKLTGTYQDVNNPVDIGTLDLTKQ